MPEYPFKAEIRLYTELLITPIMCHFIESIVYQEHESSNILYKLCSLQLYLI